jgi:hypothetical protein
MSLEIRLLVHGNTDSVSMTIGTNHRSGSAKVATTTETTAGQERTVPLWPSIILRTERAKRSGYWLVRGKQHESIVSIDHRQEANEIWTVPLWPSTGTTRQEIRLLVQGIKKQPTVSDDHRYYEQEQHKQQEEPTALTKPSVRCRDTTKDYRSATGIPEEDALPERSAGVNRKMRTWESAGFRNQQENRMNTNHRSESPQQRLTRTTNRGSHECLSPQQAIDTSKRRHAD